MPDDLLTIVRNHTAVDQREEESLRIFRDTVVLLSDPCSEQADPTHVTASALVVSHPGMNRGTVLHLHKRLNIWLQPGGHIEVGELPHEAALREAREETGLDVAHPEGGPVFFHLDVHPGPRGHRHLDLRYVVFADGTAEPAPGEGESPDARWFSWSEAAAVADPGLAGALVRVRTYVR